MLSLTQRLCTPLPSRDPLNANLDWWFLAKPDSRTGYGSGAVWLDATGTHEGTFGSGLNNGNWDQNAMSETNQRGMGSLRFDGAANDFVSFGSANQIFDAEPFTFSIWCMLTAFSPSIYPTLVNVNNDTDSNVFQIFFSSGTNYKDFGFGSKVNWIRSRATLVGTVLGTWRQVTVTYNGKGDGTRANFKAYDNCTDLTLSNVTTYGSNTGNNKIGDQSSGANRWNGRIASVQKWSRELSHGEVCDVYEDALRGYPRLLNWSPLITRRSATGAAPAATDNATFFGCNF